jgi:hypothetical protein
MRSSPSTGSVFAFAVIEAVGAIAVVLACACTTCDPDPQVMPKVMLPGVDSVTA